MNGELQCVECGKTYSITEGRGNPHWCPECDEKRIKRISGQFEKIAKRFEEMSAQ